MRITGRRKRDLYKKLRAVRPYVCSKKGCGATESLTVDHRIALCFGGTNDLDNLEYMCEKHNNEKSVIEDGLSRALRLVGLLDSPRDRRGEEYRPDPPVPLTQRLEFPTLVT